MHPLPDRPVFTPAEARALGWTRSALRHGLAAGRLVSPRRGLYALAEPPSPSGTARLAAIAAARGYPCCAVSNRSGVLLHRLPLLGPRPPLPEITLPPRASGNASSAHLYRADLRPDDVVMIGETRVTSVARTIVDVARHHSVRTAVVAADAALHCGLTTAPEIDDVLVACWNWPGIRRAHRVVDLMDGRSESPLESISRLVMPHLGLPAPQPQAVILDQYGRFVARTDFYWDEYGVAGEADGRSKYEDLGVVWDEKERQDLLTDMGLVIARWGWNEADRYPHLLSAKVREAFERAERRDRSGLPRLWSLGAPADDPSAGKRGR